MEYIYTSEFVSPSHPDKICDFIADSILDAYLEQDKYVRCAIEVMGGHGVITISGEITSRADIDIEKIAQDIVGLFNPETGDRYKINIFLEKQSSEIARGVDNGGAGDQGIMTGYATAETENLMPQEYELARNLCRKIYEKHPYDGKTQVTTETSGKRQITKIKTVVVSFQKSKTEELEEIVRTVIDAQEYIINPAGEWRIGGFDADSGLSGRKIVVDSYGPRVSVGGGSFSGKDATKVDRSGAYMARKIAVDYIKSGAKEAFVKLAYAIGKPEPVMAIIKTGLPSNRIEEKITGYDLRPRAIIEQLQLQKPNFSQTCQWGHFGNGFKWDE